MKKLSEQIADLAGDVEDLLDGIEDAGLFVRVSDVVDDLFEQAKKLSVIGDEMEEE